MTSRLGRFVRNFLCLLAIVAVSAVLVPGAAAAAPYAAIVQDARTGEVLHAENADTRLHPASLTKMLTLYIAFEEIERGRMSLDTQITVSRHAANQPPSRLGLKAGQKIALRYLIRAAAIKSANDAAAAIGDAISGDQEKFAARMTRTAKALGMKNSTFANAHGLTARGHLSTARDMNLLGRRLFYDFPEYYNIFSRRTTDAGLAQVRNTNTRFLDAYRGADGIKTGYTVAAGFNLTASAERDGVRVIATVFGGQSTAHRNAKMAELMDIGFRRAPKHAPVQPPAAPNYSVAEENALIAEAEGPGKTIRLTTTPTTSPRPMPRPNAAKIAATSEAVAALEGDIAAALAEAIAAPPPPDTLEAQAVALADPQIAEEAQTTGEEPLRATASAPPARPENLAAPETELAEQAVPALLPVEDLPFELVATDAAQDPAAEGTLEAQAMALAASLPDAEPTSGAGVGPDSVQMVMAAAVSAPPALRKAPIFDRVEVNGPPAPAEEPVVLRLSTSDARHFGINLGRFASRSEAERVLLRTQLAESATLTASLRKVVQRGGGFEANFMGLSQDQADLACRRLQARGTPCFTIAP